MTSATPTFDILMVALVAVPEAHGAGGLQVIVANQARWLAERGHRVRVLTTDHPDGRPSEVRDGVEVQYLGVSKRDPSRFRVADWHAATVAAWPAVLTSGRPDLVHGHAEAELGLLSAGLIGPAAAIPVAATLYGSPFSGVLDHLRIAPVRERGLRGWLRAARAVAGVLPAFAQAPSYRRRPVIALSRRHARLVRLSYGARNVRVVTPGVDTDHFRPADRSGVEMARRRLDQAPGAFSWGFVGRLGFGKGADLALRALAAAVPMGDRLLLAGDGPERGALESMAAQLGLADRVSFLGALADPEVVYRASDAFLFPTRHEESFGLSLAEAMASGLPILASRRGAVAEVVGDAGWLLPADEVPAWAAAMGRLAADAELRSALAAKARRRAVERFDRRHTLLSLERTYRGLVATGRSS